MVKTLMPVQKAQVQSLVRELRSHMPCNAASQKIKTKVKRRELKKIEKHSFLYKET